MPGLIYLNVGGIKYQTYQTTLIDRSRFFSSMLLGPWKETGLDPDNPIFIDRDGDNFRHILAHLRDINHQIPRTLEYELAYYQITYEFKLKHPTMFQLQQNQMMTKFKPFDLNYNLHLLQKMEDRAPLELNGDGLIMLDNESVNSFIMDPPAKDNNLKTHHIGFQMINFDTNGLISQTKIPPTSDYFNNFSLIISLDQEINMDSIKDKGINLNYWKYHMLDRIEISLAHNILYQFRAHELWMFDQIHQSWFQNKHDQLLELQTTQIVFQLPQVFIDMIHSNYQKHAITVYFNESDFLCNINYKLSMQMQTFYADLETRRSRKNKIIINQLIGGNIIYMDQFGPTYNITLDKCAHIEKIYFMVADRNDFTKTIPIKHIQMSVDNVVIYEACERMITKHMSKQNVFPNAHVYLIDFNPPKSVYDAYYDPKKLYRNFERLNNIQVKFKMYEDINSDCGFHFSIMQSNMMCSENGMTQLLIQR